MEAGCCSEAAPACALPPELRTEGRGSWKGKHGSFGMGSVSVMTLTVPSTFTSEQACHGSSLHLFVFTTGTSNNTELLVLILHQQKGGTRRWWNRGRQVG